MKIRGLFFLKRYPVLALVSFLLLVALVLMSVRVRQQKGIAFVDAFVMELCAPFQRASTFVIQSFQRVCQQYLFLVHLQRENEILKQQIVDLEKENTGKEEALLAKERLRKLLQFRETLPVPTVAAEVIGQDPSAWFRSLTINKGETEGVRKGMAVISPEGVVGQILKAAPHYATVLLITDYNSAVDSIVQKTRARAIVEGKGENRCQLKYLLRAEEVSAGDVVLTSGLSGNFPKGLLIGEIRGVEKKGRGVFQYAELVPSADLTRLEEVLVITDLVFPSLDEKARKPKKFPGGGEKKR